MYYVIFRSDTYPYNYSKVGGYSFATVSEAGAARQLSGDLVVDENLVPVQGDDWLFEWEKKEDCYARRMQKAALEGNWQLGTQHQMLNRI